MSALLAACSSSPQFPQQPLPIASTPTRSLPAIVQPTSNPAVVYTPTRAPTVAQSKTVAPSPTPLPTRVPAPSETPAPTPATSSESFAAGMLARQNDAFPRAVAAFQAALNQKPPADLVPEIQFRLGETLALSGDTDRAIAALNDYLKANPNGAHASESHYVLADLYRKRNDDANALSQLQAFRRASPSLAGDTDATIADVLARLGDAGGAIAQYEQALQDPTLAASTRANILMRAAVVHLTRGEADRAAARYDAALALASEDALRATINLNAGQAFAAANRMDLAAARWTAVITQTADQPAAVQALAELTNHKLPVDDLQRGLVEFNAGNYDAASSSLQRYLQGPAPRAAQAHLLAAQIYAAQDDYIKAIAESDLIIKRTPQDPLVPSAYLAKAEAYQNLGNTDEAVRVLKAFVSAVPDASSADQGLLRAGLYLERAKRYREAAVVLDQLVSNYPQRERAAEALFRSGLDYYRVQDGTTASARWELLAAQYRESEFYTGALYWLGKQSMARGQTDAARSYWTRGAAVTLEIFRAFRRTFYAYRSQAALKPAPAADPQHIYDLTRFRPMDAATRTELEKWLVNWTHTNNANPAELSPAVRAHLNYQRGDEFFRLQRYDEAHLEFSALVDAWEEDPIAMYALALYFQDKGLYDFTIACAIRLWNLAAKASALPGPRGLGMLKYPTYYADLVVAESKANGLDPLVYFALIRLESRFNTRVTGPAGERGLAQIGPHVAPSIAAALNVPDFDLSQLDRPYLNLRFGAWLFAQNSRQLNDPLLAFAAYNAGLGSALSWQAADIDLALEDMNIESARTYVHIVYPYWQEYQQVYP